MKTSSSAASRIQANLQELFKADLALGDAYIRFQLTSNLTVLLSMEQVQESLIVEAEKITPLPNLPEFFIGMLGSRDRVFCVVDLAQLLTLPSRLISPRQYQIIVLQTTSEPTIHVGLAVTRLTGIVRLPREKIQSSLDGVSSNIAHYLCGVVQEEQTMIPVLEFNRLEQALTDDHN